MSKSSLIHSLCHTGKPPEMSGMGLCLHLLPEYLPARIRKIITTVVTTAIKVQGGH